MVDSGRPLWAAVVATPILNKWDEKLTARRPSWEMTVLEPVAHAGECIAGDE